MNRLYQCLESIKLIDPKLIDEKTQSMKKIFIKQTHEYEYEHEYGPFKCCFTSKHEHTIKKFPTKKFPTKNEHTIKKFPTKHGPLFPWYTKT